MQLNVGYNLSLSSLLCRPTQLYFRGMGRGGEGGEPKNEALLFQSTVDIHLQTAHKTLFQSTVDIHFQNAHKTLTKLRRLALYAFICNVDVPVNDRYMLYIETGVRSACFNCALHWLPSAMYRDSQAPSFLHLVAYAVCNPKILFRKKNIWGLAHN